MASMIFVSHLVWGCPKLLVEELIPSGALRLWAVLRGFLLELHFWDCVGIIQETWGYIGNSNDI